MTRDPDFVASIDNFKEARFFATAYFDLDITVHSYFLYYFTIATASYFRSSTASIADFGFTIDSHSIEVAFINFD